MVSDDIETHDMLSLRRGRSCARIRASATRVAGIGMGKGADVALCFRLALEWHARRHSRGIQQTAAWRATNLTKRSLGVALSALHFGMVWRRFRRAWRVRRV